MITKKEKQTKTMQYLHCTNCCKRTEHNSYLRWIDAEKQYDDTIYIAQCQKCKKETERSLVCCACGTKVDYYCYPTLNEQTYCSTCLLELFVVCNICFKWKPKKESMVIDYTSYCISCLEKKISEFKKEISEFKKT